MPEAVSIGFLAGYAAINLLVRSNNGVSPEASAIRLSASRLLQSTERSVVLFGKRADALSDLQALINECGVKVPNDQGEGLDSVALELAEDFLLLLPDEIPAPELAPEPGGSISLDWIQSKNRLFSLSIGNSRRLPFAWLDGTDRGNGVSTFDGQKVPSRIIEGIRQITNGDPSLRPC